MFSGVAQAYNCPKCGRGYSAVLPTSIMPMLAVIFAATFFWAQFLQLYVNNNIFAVLLAFGLASSSYLAYLFAISHFANRWLRTKQCVDCQEPLVSVGGGFIDGSAPSLQELSMYLFVVSLPLFSRVIFGSGSPLTFLPS